MKTYSIYYFNPETQQSSAWMKDDVAKVDADSPIEALRKIYQYYNQIAGQFKNFVYEAIAEETDNIQFYIHKTSV